MPPLAASTSVEIHYTPMDTVLFAVFCSLLLFNASFLHLSTLSLHSFELDLLKLDLILNSIKEKSNICIFSHNVILVIFALLDNLGDFLV